MNSAEHKPDKPTGYFPRIVENEDSLCCTHGMKFAQHCKDCAEQTKPFTATSAEAEKAQFPLL